MPHQRKETKFEEAMRSVVITSPNKGRWVASHPDHKDFTAQGTTQAECTENARANLKWYLEKMTKNIK
jgi:predicted RNase H-like HicB family nuclease